MSGELIDGKVKRVLKLVYVDPVEEELISIFRRATLEGQKAMLETNREVAKAMPALSN